MKKRILALCLSLVMVLPCFGSTPVYAATQKTEKQVDYQTSILSEEEEETEVIFNEVSKKDEKGTTKTYWVVNDASIKDPKEKSIMIEDYLEAEKVSLTRYVAVSRGLNIRTFPNITYKNVYKTLPYGQKVEVIGISEEGWAIVELNGDKYFCWSEYLTDEKPIIKKTSTSKTTTSYTSGSGTTSLGTYSLTAYCNCSKCCGQWAGGKTASGTTPTQGRTVACNSLPFGTKISINGNIYTVEDTGNMGGNVIDIYFNSHSEALQFGRRSAKVFLVQ